MPISDPLPTPGARTLSDLLGGDETRVVRILRAFCSVANHDLLQLDETVRKGDGHLAREIAHKLAMACHLVGESRTGLLLEAAARSGNTLAIDPVMTQLINRARSGLIDSIARISLRIEAIGDDDDDPHGFDEPG